MFIREVSRKNRDGSTITYVQLVESVWDPRTKMPRPKILHSFGRGDELQRASLVKLAENILGKLDPERAARLDAEEPEDGAPEKATRPFGAVYALDELWAELGLGAVVRKRFRLSGESDPRSLERALFAMVAHQATAPGSKRECWRRWLGERVHVPGTATLKLGRFYTAMDRLEENEAHIQYAAFDRIATLMNVDVDLIFFYDTTTIHWDVEEDDEERVWKRPPRDAAPFRLRGHNKDYRDDAPQVVIGMAVTRDGFPVRSWIFPGNTVDVETIERVKKDLNAWNLRRMVLVGDRGMISEANMKTLAGGGGGYILGVPMRRREKEVEAVLGRAGRFKKVKDNLQVKEVWYPSRDDLKGQRFVICYNPDEARRDRKEREDLLERLEGELDALASLKMEARHQRVHDLMANKTYRKYLAEVPDDRLRIRRDKVREEEHLDGKFLITASATQASLSAEDLALGYKHLLQVERAWYRMKNILDLRPARHYAPRRIRAHVRIGQLALLLTRLVEVRTQMTWSEAQMLLDRLHSARIDADLLGTTPLPQETRRLLEKLKVPLPPRVMPFSGVRKVERNPRT
jgi:hypothetical protein